MRYKFPEIRHISDIEHALDPEYFMVAERNAHTVINYFYASPDVFPDIKEGCDIAQIRREFRGLIFDESGNLIRRPFHKFFNVNERKETHINTIDVTKKHVIYDKLDGSMIAPYKVGLDLFWGTKMGYTDVARQAEHFVYFNDDFDYHGFATSWIDAGFTPIFEWCSRSQRIVLDYKEDQLLLTAMRNMYTGEYLSEYEIMIGSEDGYENLPMCPIIKEHSFGRDFMTQAKQEEDTEGYVIRFSDGHMTKLKSDWYVALHRVKSDIEHERGVIKLILEGGLDDLRPLMTQEDNDMIDAYEKSFLESFGETIANIACVLGLIEGERLTRKDFAIKYAPKLEPHIRMIVFKMFDYGCNAPRDMIQDYLSKYILGHCNRNSKFIELRKTSIFENVIPYRPIVVNE